MELKNMRRSDRVSVELPIQMFGSDATGRVFFEEGRATVVNRDGAKIEVARKLAPQQELTIKCLETGREAEVRVVGQIEAGPQGYTYGISLIDPETNPWGIEFPPIAESEDAIGRAVLECLACHTREVTYLDDFELEVLEANQSLSRHCKRCSDASVWKKSFAEVAPEPEPADSKPPPEPREKRREPRRPLRVNACVRSTEFGDDIVLTRNISHGGLCFESTKGYSEGWKIEAAVPYSKGGGNIFLAGRIAWKQSLPGEQMVYGVAYIPYTN
jgi:hypothetical protein